MSSVISRDVVHGAFQFSLGVELAQTVDLHAERAGMRTGDEQSAIAV
jgi:hypothetical protein